MAQTKIVPIQCKTLLLKHKYLDDWFLSRYGMNLYRGCQHACEYCDGRSQRYYVHEDFGGQVAVKVNALQILTKELARLKERAVIVIGGGVGDSYQPVERQYWLTRQVLELILRFDLPCLILTKSELVLRDLDILSEINQRSLALVLFSISSLDQSVWSRFEPQASPPRRRLAAIQKVRRAGIPTGVMFLPILPFLSDLPEQMEQTVCAAREHGAQFIMPGALTLRDRGKQHYLRVLRDWRPRLAAGTEELFPTENENPPAAYQRELNRRVFQICQKLNIPIRIPHRLFKGRIEREHEVVLLLMHLALFRELRCRRGKPFRSAALAIQRCKEQVEVMVHQGRLREIPGVGPVIERLVVEMVETGACEYYHQLTPWS